MATVAAADRVSFQARFFNKFPIKNYWVFYFLFSALSMIIVQFAWLQFNENSIYIFSYMLYGIKMAFSGSGIVWMEDLLYGFAEELPKLTGWTQKKSIEYIKGKANTIFEPRAPILFALFFCFIAVFGDYYLVGLPFKAYYAKITYLVFEFFYLFWSLAAICIILRFAFFIHELSNEDLKIDLIQNKNSGLMRLGKIHLRTALFAIVPYTLGIIARFFGDWEMNMFLILWFSIFAVSIMIYLIWPLFNFHKSILQQKEACILRLNSEINVIISKEKTDDEEVNRLSRLISIRAFVEEANTWPFEVKKIVGLFSAVLIPLLSVAFEIFSRR